MTRKQNYSLNPLDGKSEKGQVNKGFEFDDPAVKEIPPGGNNVNGSVKVTDDDDGQDRQQWDKPIEFLLSCIAMSVGLGNVWRFPFTAYDNGGGAFIIPYLIVLFFIGKPMYFLEMAVGQFSSRGQVKIWSMAKIFKGIGYGSACGTVCVVSYYVSIMAITVLYFVNSFRSVLPWTICNPEWVNSTEGDETIECINNTVVGSNLSIPEIYFNKDVLNLKDSIDDGLGLPDWRLALCLLFSWTFILVSLYEGVQSAGKVAYFTAMFPYVVLIILLIRGVTLEGAIDGIWYFIKPDWKKILEAKVWTAAVTQCFFSLSTGFGPIIMFASYNPFTHNAYRDAMIISLMDTFTSMLAGVTIFSILGNLAFERGVSVDKVASPGTGLAFVSYPDAIAKFDNIAYIPQIFSVLFFLMLFTLGVGSATSLAGGLITLLHDQFPSQSKKHLTIFVCIAGFLIGLLYVTPGGQWMVELVDYYGAGFVIYIMAICEMIGITWVYGLNNICRDIEFMLNRKISFYWRFCWSFFIPVMLTAILIYSFATSSTLQFGNKDYPLIAHVCGWILTSTVLLVVPFFAIHSIMMRSGDSFMEKLKEALKPTDDWGPKRESIRQQWLALPKEESTLRSIKNFISMHHEKLTSKKNNPSSS